MSILTLAIMQLIIDFINIHLHVYNLVPGDVRTFMNLPKKDQG